MPNVKSNESGGATSSFVPLPGQDTDKNDEKDEDKDVKMDIESTATTTEVQGTKRRRDESGEFSVAFLTVKLLY